MEYLGRVRSGHEGELEVVRESSSVQDVQDSVNLRETVSVQVNSIESHGCVFQACLDASRESPIEVARNGGDQHETNVKMGIADLSELLV